MTEYWAVPDVILTNKEVDTGLRDYRYDRVLGGSRLKGLPV